MYHSHAFLSDTKHTWHLSKFYVSLLRRVHSGARLYLSNPGSQIFYHLLSRLRWFWETSGAVALSGLLLRASVFSHKMDLAFKKRTDTLRDINTNPLLTTLHNWLWFTVSFLFRSDWVGISFFLQELLKTKRCLWLCILDVSLLFSLCCMCVWFADIQHPAAGCVDVECLCVWREDRMWSLNLLFLLLQCKLLCNICRLLVCVSL